jgi:hypothetical protein
VLHLLLAPLVCLGRGPLRVLLACVEGTAACGALACLLSVPLTLEMRASLWEPIVAAYGLGALAAAARWLRARRPVGSPRSRLKFQRF